MRRFLPQNTGTFGYVKEPNVKDIQTTDLIYFSPKIPVDKYINFCKRHNITSIPDISDPTTKYDFYAGKNEFIRTKITKEQRIRENFYIFDPVIQMKFNSFDVLFVYNGSNLVGALHYTDYNKMIVTIYLFSQIIELEYLLRALIKKQGLSLIDLFKFWLSKKSKPFYKQRLLESKDILNDIQNKDQKFLSDFSTVYLTDLIDLLNHHKVLKISRSIQELRNRIMHAKSNIKKTENFSTHGLLQNLDSFNLFFRQVLLLKQTRKQVESLLRL